jgi:uncharacterized protein YjbI with pentapeptide repeats
MAGMAREPRKNITKPDESSKQLEELRKQAGDLGVARKALDDAVSMTRGLWISFISLSAYLMVAVGSVTHVDLFLEKPLKLPLLLVDVPLVVFFWLTPILYLIVHTYLLLNLKLMSDNVRAWLARLGSVLQPANNIDERNRIGDEFKIGLPNFFAVQMLAGTSENRSGFIRWALAASVMNTVVVGPVLLLCLFQLQFLPYHNETVSWMHRAAILIDMGALWYFWPRIRGKFEFAQRWFLKAFAVLGTISVALTSIFVAAFPYETVYRNDLTDLINFKIPALEVCNASVLTSSVPGTVTISKQCRASTVRDLLFDGSVNEVTGLPYGPFANRLVLTDKEFSADKITSISLRGRHLEGAVLVRTNLQSIDLTGAKLRGANLEFANLRDAKLECGNARRSNETIGVSHENDDCADLRGANLGRANLERTSLEGAFLQGALLFKINLQGANLRNAHLQGAFLMLANLQGTQLSGAELQGAYLGAAKLKGANLSKAKLQGSNLFAVHAEGAKLNGSNLQGSSLLAATLEGVVAIDVDFRRADVDIVDPRWSNSVSEKNKTEGEIFLNKQAFDEFYAIIIESIPEGALKEQSRVQLAALDPTKKFNHTSNRKIWNVINDMTMALPERNSSAIWRGEQWKKRMQFVVALTCSKVGAPFVANSLIIQSSQKTGNGSAGFLDTGGPFTMALIRRIFDGNKCPGAIGISDDAKEVLEQYSAESYQCELPLPDESQTEMNEFWCFRGAKARDYEM